MLTKSQQRIVNFLLCHDKALVWADAGSGKTLAILAYLKQTDVSTILIVAPKQVVDRDVWGKEARKWRVGGFRIELINYEGYNRLRLDNYDIVIFDEAQRLKGRTTSTGKGGSKRAYKWRELARRTPKVIGLTGTPSNNIFDMYYIFKNLDINVPGFVSTGLLNTAAVETELNQFIALTCKYSQTRTPYGMHISNPQLKPEYKDWFMELISQSTIRVLYDFPYEEVHLEFTAEVDPRVRNLQLGFTLDGLDAITVFEAAGKLQQAANGFLYEDVLDADDNVIRKIVLIDDYKERVLKHFTTSILSNDKCIFIYKFKVDQAILLKYKRPDDIVLSIRQSEGVNYQEEGFSKMFFMNPDYSIIDMKQMIARVARKGQTKPVTIYYAIRKGSVDTKVLRLLEGKGTIYDIIR